MQFIINKNNHNFQSIYLYLGFFHEEKNLYTSVHFFLQFVFLNNESINFLVETQYFFFNTYRKYEIVRKNRIFLLTCVVTVPCQRFKNIKKSHSPVTRKIGKIERDKKKIPTN